MISKMKPKVFTEEQKKALRGETAKQKPLTSAPTSTDPINFPVFDVPVNRKVLIYVPNHVVQNEEGVDELRMDKPLIHMVIDGRRFLRLRCVVGLSEEAGFSGECPLCNATSEPWDLARYIIDEKCRNMGLNPEDKDNTQVKAIRSAAFGDRVIKEAERYLTFPIVVIETEGTDAKKIVYDEETGNIKYKVMWYSISEAAYEKKWLKVLEGMEDEPTHPGGNFFILNYCYTPKNGEPNKRDSAREMTVIHKNIKDSDQIKEYFNQITEEWTPEKAQETVINNQLYDEDTLQKAADELLTQTREKIAFYESMGAGVASEDEGFTLSPTSNDPQIAPGIEQDTSLPTMHTDLDS